MAAGGDWSELLSEGIFISGVSGGRVKLGWSDAGVDVAESEAAGFSVAGFSTGVNPEGASVAGAVTAGAGSKDIWESGVVLPGVVLPGVVNWRSGIPGRLFRLPGTLIGVGAAGRLAWNQVKKDFPSSLSMNSMRRVTSSTSPS